MVTVVVQVIAVAPSALMDTRQLVTVPILVPTATSVPQDIMVLCRLPTHQDARPVLKDIQHPFLLEQLLKLNATPVPQDMMVLCRLPTHQDATHADPIRSNQQLETVAPARVSLQATSLLLMVQPMLI